MKEYNSKEKDKRLSPDAKFVWDHLDQKTQEEIQKHYRPKLIRNRKIMELRLKGVTYDILAELTGLNRTTVFNVIKRVHDMPEYVNEETKGLVRAFESLLNGLTRLLNNKAREQLEGEEHEKKEQ